MTDSKKIQKNLDQLPINWSKLSEMLTGNKFAIRSKGRDPIPKKYHKVLFELIEVFEKWQDSNCT